MLLSNIVKQKQTQPDKNSPKCPNPCIQNPKINILPCFVIPTLCVRPSGTWPTLIEPPSKENNGENIDAIRRNCAIISRSFISTPADTVCLTKILPLVPDYWGVGVEIGGRTPGAKIQRGKKPEFMKQLLDYFVMQQIRF